MLIIMKVNCNDEGIEKAIQIIGNGGIIIFPTDTVYGIGCDPYNDDAIKKIYQMVNFQPWEYQLFLILKIRMFLPVI